MPSAVRGCAELETAGYIVRNQLRDQQGRISDNRVCDL